MISVIDPALGVFAFSLALSALLTPAARRAALRWNVLDHPSVPIKTHRDPTPYLGGLAVFASVAITLVCLRLATHFPSGTLRALWAVLAGGGFMTAVGLLDDCKPGGMNFRWKFFFQFLSALILMAFDIRIKFIQPDWLAGVFTVLWVVGITNAFNIIDIMDGLSASQATAAALGFLLISLPGEQVYVNVTSAALAGACLGFLPYNFSSRRKIFMGDAGSLFLGFTLAAVSMGMSYTRETEFGVFAPLLILGLPIYDTVFVSAVRIRQGKSPFLGSKDHLALKVRSLGVSPRSVVAMMAAAAALFSLAAYGVLHLPFYVACFLLLFMGVVGLFVALRLRKVQVP